MYSTILYTYLNWTCIQEFVSNLFIFFENFWTCSANHFAQGDGVSTAKAMLTFRVRFFWVVSCGGRREGCPDGLECSVYGLQTDGGLCWRSVAQPSVKIGPIVHDPTNVRARSR